MKSLMQISSKLFIDVQGLSYLGNPGTDWMELRYLNKVQVEDNIDFFVCINNDL